MKTHNILLIAVLFTCLLMPEGDSLADGNMTPDLDNAVYYAPNGRRVYGVDKHGNFIYKNKTSKKKSFKNNGRNNDLNKHNSTKAK